MTTIGILHPGQMGIVLAASARQSGNEVLWVSHGRSAATRKRAEAAGLADAGSLADLSRKASIILSVCPPEFAEALALEVAHSGFRGTLVDANAISPQRARKIATQLSAAGIRFVDGGIIGLPSLEPGQTWLHLSGPEASSVGNCLAGGCLAVDVMDAEIGRASALKMCFAAYSKGSVALASAVAAAAEELGVLDDLQAQWDRKGPGAARLETDMLRAAPKAWRWAAEMHEISATLEAAGLPGGFHLTAAGLFERLRSLKDADGLTPERVRTLLRPAIEQ